MWCCSMSNCRTSMGSRLQRACPRTDQDRQSCSLRAETLQTWAWCASVALCAASFQRLSSPALRWRHCSDIAAARPLGTRRRRLIALGGIVVALIATSDHDELRGACHRGADVGWGFIGTGLFAWDRRPNNSVGSLMVATGFAWLLGLISASNLAVLFTAGALVSSLYIVTALHTLLAAPYGRGLSRGDRRIVTVGYLLVTVGLLPMYLFLDPARDGCDGCPDNVILIEHNETVVGIWSVAREPGWDRRARGSDDQPDPALAPGHASRAPALRAGVRRGRRADDWP